MTRWVIGLLVKCMCLLALPAVGAYALRDHLAADRYVVRSIIVDGTRVLDPNDIALRSGVTNEDLLFLVNPSEVASRVETMPYVKACRASREFPDTVYIYVTERVAAAAVLVNNRCFAIDDEYVVLEELPLEKEIPGVLITSLPGVVSIDLNQTLPGEEIGVALAIWRAFSGTEMAKDVRVSEIAASSVNEIRMFCVGLPFEIRWRQGDVEDQAKRLDALWRAKDEVLPCTEYLDLRFGRDLAWK